MMFTSAAPTSSARVFVLFAALAVAPIPLGKLQPFWRYSPALGPFLEQGQALLEIPDYVTRSDFPYRKRPYPQEVPFADHLSIVRLLGGYDDGVPKGSPDPKVHQRDLVYRDANGRLAYRMDLLHARLKPYLDNGYRSFTLVLDNIPYCMAKTPKYGAFGHCAAPDNPAEWREFIKTLCLELKKLLGDETANQLRFRVGTEANGTERFNGTQQQFVQHYDAAAAAVKEVLPSAKVGPFNCSGISLRGIVDQTFNVNLLALAHHCLHENNLASGAKPTPLDWIAYSRYYRPGTDPEEYQQVCQSVWDEMERREPQLKGVSREIHEFGMAPWGEVAKGTFPSAEPGALGAALTCQIMWRLRAAGINRLWHWSVTDALRSRKGQLRHLFTGQAWLLCVMEQMVGGNSYLFSPLDKSRLGTKHLMAGSFQNGGALLMISAYHPQIDQHGSETVRFRLPGELLRPDGKTVRFVELNQKTSVHDSIRRELEAEKLLNDDFRSRPDRLGLVREMSPGREAPILICDHEDRYTTQWIDSLTLKPLRESVGRIELDADGCTLTVHLTTPEVLVIAVR
jgi:hypothetical protein